MSNSWEDFNDTNIGPSKRELKEEKATKSDKKQEDVAACDWGFDRKDSTPDGFGQDSEESESKKFIVAYETYLRDKKAYMDVRTTNHNMYSQNPQRAFREWLDEEGHEELKVKTDQPQENQYICSIDIPVGEHDFSITSQVYPKKQLSMDEVCIIACKLLDDCNLLYSWHNSTDKDSHIDKKRQFKEANKEDDIELDSTCSKRHCNSSPHSGLKQERKVNTYDSLMADWKELNMSILLLKAKLVKLDLSVTKKESNSKDCKTSSCQGNDGVKLASKCAKKEEEEEDEEDVDPLDEFMSSLETKTELSFDEKIEKTRIKSQIAAFELKQAEVSRLIQLAKPWL